MHIRPRSVVFTVLASALGACMPAVQPAEVTVPPKAAPIVTVALDATIASADGVPIRYHSEGQGSPAIVFVHGWSCDRSYWDEQVAHFSPTHQVVTLDLAGHGMSGKNRYEWTMGAFGEDVRAVVRGLDIKKVVLVGHSMGGAVILEAARRMPDRVVGLVGVDIYGDVERKMPQERIEPWLANWRQDFPGSVKSFVDMLLPKTADPALRERIETGMAAADPEIAVPLLDAVVHYDFAAAFDAVHAPIRGITTTQRTNLEANRRHSPGFAVVDLSASGLGHFPMLEAPAVFDAKLEEVLAGLADGGAPAKAAR